LTRLRSLLPMLILLVLALVVFRELAFTDRILGRGGTFTYFYPYWTVRDNFFRAGELPLWTPDIFMGAPLLANPQIGALYPPNWLTIGLDAPNAVRVSILLHVAWATLGAYMLARRAVSLNVPGALVTAAVFGVGGYVGAHVEQINQLQGLSWFPWLFLLLHVAGDPPGRPYRWIFLLGMALAMQILSGHTQTVFISGVGMGLYCVASFRWRGLLVLAGGGVIALVLASPQLIPTLELIGVSGREGGLDANAALSFSFNPFIAGRGLLPSYDGKIFSEFIAYIGITGVVLAVFGALSRARFDERDHNGISDAEAQGRREKQKTEITFPQRRVWLTILLVALFLAVGRANPVNFWIVEFVPGFDLFRVPARWLALYGLSAAVLAGMGTQALLQMSGKVWRAMPLPVFAVLVLIGASFLARYVPEEVNGSATPTIITLVGWGVALAAIAAVVLAPGRWRVAVVPLVMLELVAASWVMPYNDLVPLEVWSAQRFTISQMLGYTETDENGLTAEGTPPGRILSISGLLFDPGDKAALSARYQALGMTPLEERYSFVAAKMKETLTPNLPMAWGIPTVDGYGGGLLPTRYYNTFMELVYPEGVDVPGDGRLQENLSATGCYGECADGYWIGQANVDYIIVDKTFDVWHEGIAFDTFMPWSYFVGSDLSFLTDRIDVLYECDTDCELPNVSSQTAEQPVDYFTGFDVTRIEQLDETLYLASVDLEQAQQIWSVTGNETFRAVTLVQEQTGAFLQLYPTTYPRLLSSDIKLYQRRRPTTDGTYATIYPRTYTYMGGDENTLDRMRSADYRVAYVATDNEITNRGTTPQQAQVTYYSPTRIELTAEHSGTLVIPESYYPGWEATINGESAPIYRANINFRAVSLGEGENHVIFEYNPAWFPVIFIVGGVAWITFCIFLAFTWRE
ncbi:MAG: YfhO family protein, partial [Chloroflexota bacterium]